MNKSYQITQRTIKSGKMTKRAVTSYRITTVEVKYSEKEAEMLKHDLREVEVSLAQWGLMVVGLVFGIGGKGNVSSGMKGVHSFRGAPSAFCSLPGIGWLGDIPSSEVDVYKVDGCSLKCGKIAYALTIKGGSARKVLIWYHRKVVSFVRETNSVMMIAKNIFDPTSRDLYELMSKIDKLIEERNTMDRFDAGRVYEMNFSQLIKESEIQDILMDSFIMEERIL